jgi:hypothetical protein
MAPNPKFIERMAPLNSLSFRGQAYHSSTPALCTLCGKSIGNVYTLCSPQGRTAVLGECCFKIFKKHNPEVYTRLLAAQLLMDAYEEGAEYDVRVYTSLGDVRFRLSEWRKLRRKALQLVREYQRATGGDWLPKPLYEVKLEADRKPGKTVRWFDSHIPLLRSKMSVSIV